MAQIPSATWQVTYRAKRDKSDFGFVWFTTAKDVSPSPIATGTHDGPNDAAGLTDSTASFASAGVMVSDFVQNTSHGGGAALTAFTATTVTAALSPATLATGAL